MTEDDIAKLSNDELLALYKKTVNTEAEFNNKQTATKLTLNACFGVLAQPSFFWFDNRLAEAITLSGQLIIQHGGREVNAYLNKLMKTDLDYVVLTDTDSIGVTMGSVVKKFLPNADKDKIINFLDKISKTEMKKLFDTKLDELRIRLGCTAQKINMKREVIGDAMIFSGKKRYVMNSLDKEGVRFAEPKLVIKGMEAVRSSTPKWAREMIKATIKALFAKGEEGLQKAVADGRDRFSKMPLEAIAIPRGVTEIRKWHNNGAIQSGCPQHVRAAIAYNLAIDKLGLGKKYEKAKEGNKIKYVHLKLPNPFQSPVIGWPSKQPPAEMQVEMFVDRDKIFSKAYLDAMENLVGPIGWSLEKRNSLDDLFS